MYRYLCKRKRAFGRHGFVFQCGGGIEPLEPRTYLSGVSFAAPVPVDAVSGANEHEVITADFNGDHLPDLAALWQNAVDILINQGDVRTQADPDDGTPGELRAGGGPGHRPYRSDRQQCSRRDARYF